MIYHKKNVYGNTAYELATKDNVKKILKKSSDEIACYSSGKKFSAAVWRYYCTHSGHFYCESETVRDQVVVEAGSSRTKPARYYKGSLKIIKNMEATLQSSCKGTLTREHLMPLNRAVKNARTNGCNVVLVHKGVRTLSRLEAQCVMEDEMKIVEGARPIGSKKQLKRLHQLVRSAREEGVRDEDGITTAEELIRATEAEVHLSGVSSLVEAIECASSANVSEIKRLDDALATAKTHGSHPGLVEDRTKLQKKLHAELGMNRSLNDPLEKAVLDEEGEPTEHCIYTMWDETTTFNTSVPGEKLKYLQWRHGGLEKAIKDATEVGTCFPSLVEKATEYEATLGLDVQEEIGKEEARIEDEAKAAAKAAKKKKKKK